MTCSSPAPNVRRPSADAHLYRARLFCDRAALAEARRLVEKHGYGRRREELADLEAKAADWPESKAS